LTQEPQSPPAESIVNIAQHLIERARVHPNAPAVICALGPDRDGRRRYTHQTFSQLNRESAEIALGLKKLGIEVGSKAVVMVRPGPDLFALTFGLFKAGIVPVLIDPGMDKKALKGCIAQADPEIFIGIPIAHLARKILGWGRRSISMTIGVGRGAWAQHSLKTIRSLGAGVDDDYLELSDPDALAAILFTSGSTGAPKGALYLHRHFAAQVALLQSIYDFQEGDVDVPTFPLFALFDPALGMSAAFPRMDYSAPAEADPEEIFAVIEDFGAKNLFCSPALLRVLADAVKDRPSEPRLASLERVISCGAPVPPTEMRILRDAAHPEAEIYTPYGATESLPVSSISSTEVDMKGEAGQAQGLGVCVGVLTPGVSVQIIPITDQAISVWSDLRDDLSEVEVMCEAGSRVGEVVVYGPSTTQGYLARPEGDRLAKIKGAPDQVITLPQQSHAHRMGDLGYFDEEGYLWLCGRKSHRVLWEGKLYLPLCVEGVLNEISGISRTALTSTSAGPVICVELARSAPPWSEVESALKARATLSLATRGLTRFYVHPGFPVDTRHNAKIKRDLLSAWAEPKVTS
jgi:olefin beta-lactone synthetase